MNILKRKSKKLLLTHTVSNGFTPGFRKAIALLPHVFDAETALYRPVSFQYPLGTNYDAVNDCVAREILLFRLPMALTPSEFGLVDKYVLTWQ